MLLLFIYYMHGRVCSHQWCLWSSDIRACGKVPVTTFWALQATRRIFIADSELLDPPYMRFGKWHFIQPLVERSQSSTLPYKWDSPSLCEMLEMLSVSSVRRQGCLSPLRVCHLGFCALFLGGGSAVKDTIPALSAAPSASSYQMWRYLMTFLPHTLPNDKSWLSSVRSLHWDQGEGSPSGTVRVFLGILLLHCCPALLSCSGEPFIFQQCGLWNSWWG